MANYLNNGTVSVISDTTNTVVATLKASAGGASFGIAYDSGKGELFVSNEIADTISVISDKTDTVVATMPVGITPAEVAYDPSNGEVFVANGINDTVSVISDATNTVVATVSVGSFPFGVAYDSFRGEVFVTNEGVPPNSNGTVSVIADLTAIAASGSPGASSWTYAGAAAGVAVIVAVAAYYTTSRGRSKPSATPALW